MTSAGTKASASLRRADDVDVRLLADVSRRYYVDAVSKVDIAKQLGLSRFKVARMLAEARARGIVKISIAVPGAVDRSLSDELAQLLSLRRCIVVDATGTEAQVREQVAAAAAALLSDTVIEGDLLGLTWSRAVDAMVSSLQHLPRCTVVQLAGSLPAPAGRPSTVDLVQRAARLAGGVAHPVHAPLVLDDAAAAAALRRQPGIRDTLRLADRLDVSVVAVGAWKPGCSTVWEAVPAALRRAGTKAGAVAEVSGHLLDRDGRAVASPLRQLVIGASLTQLRRPRTRIALVSGPSRAAATVAAVRAGLIGTLVTTRDTARAVLDQEDAP